MDVELQILKHFERVRVEMESRYRPRPSGKRIGVVDNK
jgi:hypothetical protein